MANVYFKRGPQANLDSLRQQGTFTEGTFYLTNDSDRLYFAQSASELVELNRSIRTYTGAELPANGTENDGPLTPGDFYYWTNKNILAIYLNSTNGWMQINPDTTLVQNSNALNIAANTSDTSQVFLRSSVSDTRGNTASGAITLQEGSNVHFSITGNVLTISSDNDSTNTQYNFHAATESDVVKLKMIERLSDGSDGTTAQSIEVLGGTDITVSTSGNGAIVLNGAGNGVASIGNQFSSTGSFQTVVGLSAGGGASVSSAAITPTIVYGGTGTASTVFDGTTAATPTATLNVYTTGEVDALIDNRLRQFDAMSYKGTVSSDSEEQNYYGNIIKTDSTVNAGDTYKATDNFTPTTGPLANTAIKTGDLVISRNDGGSEWDVIPSGDDQSISITSNTNANQLVFTDSLLPSDSNIIGSIAFNGGDHITVSSTATTSGRLAVTVAHGAADTANASAVSLAAATATPVGTPITIPVITGLSYDNKGHITTATGATYTIPNAVTSISSFSTVVGGVSTSGNTQTATLNIGLGLDSGSSASATANIVSNTLQLSNLSGTASPAQLGIDLVWGTF